MSILRRSRIEARHTNWRLRIVGPGTPGYVGKMKAFAASLGLERAEFLGPRYGEEKWEAYRYADLYVLPSPSENFGVSVAEALIAGTPAMTTRGAPWAQLMTERAGWCVDVGVDPLAAAVDQALQLPTSALAEMGLRGRRWMQRDFSWTRIGKDMTKLCAWIRSGGTAPPFVMTT